MKTLYKGCEGLDVKMLQRLLKITDDGIFGPKTEEAVKKYQKEHRLAVDGIVGPKTWASLGYKTEQQTKTKCVDPSVIYLPLDVHVTKYKNRPIKYIAIHYTAGGSSAAGRAKSMLHTFQKRKASADFGVDDRDMVQFNPDLNSYYCWSVGDPKNPYSGGAQLYRTATNTNTISIEICSNLKEGYSAEKANHDGWYYTDEAIENALRLTKILMEKFDIPINRVVRHYDISGKVCPGIIGWNNANIYTKDGKKTSEKNNSEQWMKFKEKLKEITK